MRCMALFSPRSFRTDSGTVSTNGSTVTYSPAVNFAGSDVFTYTISDDNGGTVTASVSVTVLPSGPIWLTPDHCNPGMDALYVQGTSGNDNIDVINAGLTVLKDRP